MIGSQLLQGFQHVGNKYEAFVPACYSRIIYNGEGTTFPESRKGIVVAVECFSLQGKEDASLGTLATVGRYDRMRLVYLV